MCISTAWALQSLWAAPWLSDVEGLMHADVVAHLFVMAVALSTGALLLGLGADQLRRGGIRRKRRCAPQRCFSSVPNCS